MYYVILPCGRREVSRAEVQEIRRPAPWLSTKCRGPLTPFCKGSSFPFPLRGLAPRVDVFAGLRVARLGLLYEKALSYVGRKES